jgi:hypothetical protein
MVPRLVEAELLEDDLDTSIGLSRKGLGGARFKWHDCLIASILDQSKS